MKNKTLSTMYRAGLAGVVTGSLWMSGCSGMQTVSVNGVTAPVPVAGLKLAGKVFGGQQPVTGATIQIYAASTAGYGSSSFALLKTAVLTDGNGNFGITGDYACPSSTSQMYIVATGGNSGGGVNNNLSLMAALGSCGNLSAATSVQMNEITTVASVWALAPFMTSYSNVGTSSTNVAGLVNAFATVNKLSNIGFGSTPGAGLPTGTTIPTTEISTLADILAACVNSTGGKAGDGSACGMLFANATPPGGVAPTVVITAAVNIAKNPSQNVSSLLVLAGTTAPFQPTLSSATDYTISIKYAAPGFSNPVAAAVDPSNNLYVANAGNGTVSLIAPTGASSAVYVGFSTPSGIAIDGSGNAWVANKGNSTMTVISGGATSTPTTSGLSSPDAVSIDGQGTVWVTNAGNNSVTALSTSGTTVTASTSYTGAGITAPVALAINPH